MSDGEEEKVNEPLKGPIWKSKIFLIITGICIIGVIAVISTAIIIAGNSKSDIEKRLEAANRYLVKLDYEQAIAEFEEIIKADPKCVEAYIGLADAYEGIGEPDKAREVLEKCYENTKSEKLKKLLSKMEEETYVKSDRENTKEDVNKTGENTGNNTNRESTTVIESVETTTEQTTITEQLSNHEETTTRQEIEATTDVVTESVEPETIYEDMSDNVIEDNHNISGELVGIRNWFGDFSLIIPEGWIACSSTIWTSSERIASISVQRDPTLSTEGSMDAYIVSSKADLENVGYEVGNIGIVQLDNYSGYYMEYYVGDSLGILYIIEKNGYAYLIAVATIDDTSADYRDAIRSAATLVID